MRTAHVAIALGVMMFLSAEAWAQSSGGRGGGGCQRGGGGSAGRTRVATGGGASRGVAVQQRRIPSAWMSSVVGSATANQPTADFWRPFDADGSGNLDSSERAALAIALRNRGASNQWIAQALARLAALERYDSDQNGQLDSAELQAAKTATAAARAPAKRPPASRRQAEILARFDADGDGKLSPSEKATMRATLSEESKSGV